VEGELLQAFCSEKCGHDFCPCRAMSNRLRWSYKQPHNSPPNHALAHLELGNVYERMGDRQRAAVEFQTALELNGTLTIAKQKVHLSALHALVHPLCIHRESILVDAHHTIKTNPQSTGLHP